jgi:two-component system chemotaxis response regulator CheB
MQHQQGRVDDQPSAALTAAEDLPLRVLIVDDCALTRRILRRILSADPRLLVVGAAADGNEALARAEELHPDAITLDVEMPGMDGFATLRALRLRHPGIHIIMCSSLTQRGSSMALDVLFAGASEYVSKPGSGSAELDGSSRFAEEIIQKIMRAAGRQATPSQPRLSHLPPTLINYAAQPANTSEAVPVTYEPALSSTPPPAPARRRRRRAAAAYEVLAIGSSTGGPAALQAVLQELPSDFPLAVLIVQHMPPVFTRLLAERLSRVTKIPVVEAQTGMEVGPGVILLAPGDYHMRVVRKLHRMEILLTQEPPENSCRPAVDVLFRSVAEHYGARAMATVLTGMGQDGLQGIRQLKLSHSPVIVQDESTSVVYGMPRAIAEAGLADAILPLHSIVPEILRLL